MIPNEMADMAAKAGTRCEQVDVGVQSISKSITSRACLYGVKGKTGGAFKTFTWFNDWLVKDNRANNHVIK